MRRKVHAPIRDDKRDRFRNLLPQGGNHLVTGHIRTIHQEREVIALACTIVSDDQNGMPCRGNDRRREHAPQAVPFGPPRLIVPLSLGHSLSALLTERLPVLLSGLLCGPLTKTLLTGTLQRDGAFVGQLFPTDTLHGGAAFIRQVVPCPIVLLSLEPGGAACQLQEPCFMPEVGALLAKRIGWWWCFGAPGMTVFRRSGICVHLIGVVLVWSRKHLPWKGRSAC